MAMNLTMGMTIKHHKKGKGEKMTVQEQTDNHKFISYNGDLYDRENDRPIRTNYSKRHRFIKTIADLKATLRAGIWARPGGYPLYLIAQNGNAISFKGAREYFEDIIFAMNRHGDQGLIIISTQVNYWDNDLYCVLTDERIESAYGE